MTPRLPTPFGLLFTLVVVMAGCGRATLPPPAPSSAQPPSRASETRTPETNQLDDVLLRFQKASALVENGKLKEARTALEALRTRYPHVSVFHNNLGVVYKRLGLLSDAIASYQQAITIQPNYAEALYNLGLALREQGAFREAEAAYRRALTMEPDFRDAHYNLAVLYDLYLDVPDRAIDHYQAYLSSGGEGRDEITIWIAALEKRRDRAQEGQ